MIIVNGEQIEFVENTTVSDLIEALRLSCSQVAVELNGEIVSRASFDDTLLHDDDKVEIVHFVGGG
jgi:thiamine biosynthesis protein ThiS